MRKTKKNNGKAMILFYAMVIIVGGLSFSDKMVSANNCADETFTFHYSGDGTDYTSKARKIKVIPMSKTTRAVRQL